jgi:phosphomannomutase
MRREELWEPINPAKLLHRAVPSIPDWCYTLSTSLQERKRRRRCVLLVVFFFSRCSSSVQASPFSRGRFRSRYDDHSPPHFHASYGSAKVVVSLSDLAVVKGALPPRAMGLLLEWAIQHRPELEENWDLERERSNRSSRSRPWSREG